MLSIEKIKKRVDELSKTFPSFHIDSIFLGTERKYKKGNDFIEIKFYSY